MVFDRELKRRQRDQAVQMSHFEHCQYLKEELAYRAADRIYDCTDFFEVAVDLGAGCGWIAPNVFKVRQEIVNDRKCVEYRRMLVVWYK